MKRTLLSTAALAAIAGGAAAQDLAATVDEFVAQAEAFGATVSIGSREGGNGGPLTLRDISYTSPDDSVTLRLDSATFTPEGDDVTVTLAPQVVFTFAGSEATDEVPAVPETDVVMTHQNLSLTTNAMGGLPDMPSATITADSLAFAGGDPSHPVLKSLDLSFEDVNTGFEFDMASRDLSAQFGLGASNAAYAIADLMEPSAVIETSLAYDTVQMTLEATSLPQGPEGSDAFLAEGGFVLTLESGPAQSSFASSSPELPMSVSSDGGPATAEIAIENGEFRYLTEFGNVNYSIQPDPEVLPMPAFDLSMDGGEMAIRTPVAPTDGAADLQFLIAFENVVADDRLWSMIDPQGAIPRDPANLRIDVTAAAELTRPLSQAPMTASPLEMGQVQELTINALNLSVAGTSLEGDGALTFDYPGPVPVPTGEINISLAGLQGLANTLVELGVVDQMQVGMGMGMLMAFAQPAGDDRFETKLEFRDGQILANGQPLPQ